MTSFRIVKPSLRFSSTLLALEGTMDRAEVDLKRRLKHYWIEVQGFYLLIFYSEWLINSMRVLSNWLLKALQRA
jgi:hypothetical protein